MFVGWVARLNLRCLFFYMQLNILFNVFWLLFVRRIYNLIQSIIHSNIFFIFQFFKMTSILYVVFNMIRTLLLVLHATRIFVFLNSSEGFLLFNFVSERCQYSCAIDDLIFIIYIVSQKSWLYFIFYLYFLFSLLFFLDIHFLSLLDILYFVLCLCIRCL